MIFRCQLSFQYGSALPRDAMAITPHFFGSDPVALANALKTNIIAAVPSGATLPFTIKVYNAQAPPPSYPLATVTNGTGFAPYNNAREIAICLSYYSTYNRKSYRGRLYLPGQWVGGAFQERPSQTQRDAALAFKSIFTTGMPATHNWVVFSRKLNQSFGVTNCWVDDEWDVIRSRGLRGTVRSLANVP